jgi:hypothetical protein
VGRSAPPSSNTSKRRPRRVAVQIFLLVAYIPFSLLSLARLPYLFFNAIVREKKKINHLFSVSQEVVTSRKRRLSVENEKTGEAIDTL